MKRIILTTLLSISAKDLKVRMYSTAVVAQQFFSKLYAAKDQADDDPAALRRLDCHKQLLSLRAMNVKVEHGEEEGDSTRKEEELQEWLDSIEARKAANQASKKKKDSKASVKRYFLKVQFIDLAVLDCGLISFISPIGATYVNMRS